VSIVVFYAGDLTLAMQHFNTEVYDGSSHLIFQYLIVEGTKLDIQEV
jgi:hypothetical protein